MGKDKLLKRLIVRGKMYLIFSVTLFMFIVKAQFFWMSIRKMKDIGLEKTTVAIADSHRKPVKVAVDALAAVLATAL